MPHRGEIYFADLDPVRGSEQGGVRPVLILQNNTGNRYTPTVIAAAVVGGTSLSGGTGNMFGTFLGVVLIAMISNSINLWGVPAAYDNVVTGSVIGAAALIDALRTRKKRIG